MTTLSNHFDQIAKGLEEHKNKIAALDAEIESLGLADQHAKYLALLIRLKKEYAQIHQQYEGLSEACLSIMLEEARLR